MIFLEKAKGALYNCSMSNKKCKAMESIGFIINPTKEDAVRLVKGAVDRAAERGFTCVLDPDAAQFAGIGACASFESHKPDMLAVFGGDGTILKAAARAVELDVPVLGVNFGRLGFLSEVAIEDFGTALDALRGGGYSVDQRLLLECRVNDGAPRLCINDALLYKESFSGVVDIDVSIDGVPAGTVSCDGLIISTPTGATGYSISAGGPVIAPGLDACIITPICPHALCFRPIITSPKASMRFVLRNPGLLAVDGVPITNISQSDEISISCADRRVGFIRVSQRNLYSLIRSKLS